MCSKEEVRFLLTASGNKHPSRSSLGRLEPRGPRQTSRPGPRVRPPAVGFQGVPHGHDPPDFTSLNLLANGG